MFARGFRTTESLARAVERAGNIRIEWERSEQGWHVARLWAGDPWAPARLLVELGKLDAGDPAVRRVALPIVHAASGGGDLAILATLQRWVQKNIRFVKEPVETFQSARYTLEVKAGDCDDHATLLYALASACGLKARFAFLPKAVNGITYPAHAVSQVCAGRAWQWAETTVAAHVGEHPFAAAKRLGIARQDIADQGVVTMGDLRVGPEGDVTEGLDTSSLPANPLDYAGAFAEGARFALLRLAFGTSLEKNFAVNVAAARAAGLKVGGYLFFRPSVSPDAQVAAVVAQIGQKIQAGDLPPAIDVEPVGNAADDGLSKEEWLVALRGVVDGLRNQYGTDPLLYTSPGFWDTLPESELDGGLPLWVAGWGVGAPLLPRGWKTWLFWQYWGNPTANWPPDKNRFNGSESDLDAFVSSLPSIEAAQAGADEGCVWTILRDAEVTVAVSARAVTLLRAWRQDPNATVGVTFSEEWTGSKFLRYAFEWHPPDAQNTTPGGHSGVTVYVCRGKARPPSGGGQAGPVRLPLSGSRPAPVLPSPTSAVVEPLPPAPPATIPCAPPPPAPALTPEEQVEAAADAAEAEKLGGKT